MLTACPGTARADASATQPQAAAGDPSEILVTAQKRRDNIRDVPISITAIGGEKFGNLVVGGEDIRALAGRVPNLNVESTFGRVFPRFYIRGLGNSDYTLNSQASVAQYYDEVVLENQVLRGMPAFDLERLEVLRGPQGTLWGRNATAGAVHLISRKPTAETAGYANLSFGRFGTTTLETALGGRVAGDSLLGRVAVLYQHQGNSVTNITTGGKLGGYDDIAARAQLLYSPDSGLSALLQFSMRSLDGTSTLFNGKQPGLPFAKTRIALESDHQSQQKLHQYGLTLNLKYDLGGAELTSITSWQSGDLFSVGDIDGSPRPALINTSIVNGLDQYTQELRLASQGAGPLGWQVGAFFFQEDLAYTNLTANNSFKDANGNPGFGAYQFANQRNRSWALFGQSSYKIGDSVTLTGGLRYTRDRIRLSQDTAFFTPNPADLTAAPNFSSAFYAGGGNGPFAVTQPRFSGAAENSGKLTWDVSANVRASRAINLYARIARGYHSGVITGQAMFSPIETAGPETILSYEAGLKSEFADRRVRFNAAVFHYDFKDMQLTSFVRDGSGSDIIRLVNAAGGKGTGFEADLTLRPNRYVSLGGQIGYVATHITGPTFVANPVVANAKVDIAGQPFPFAPKWTGGVDAEVRLPVSGTADLFAATDWSYRGAQNFTLTSYLQPELRAKGWWEGGFKAGYRRGGLEVSGWMRNALNATGFTSAVNVNGLAYVFNAPMTFGASLATKF